ncbi:MAG: sigma-70 family RNA polymerase sigma factor, partial [Planctomycetales bacterium]|nr:sigma-70 family RNA polymerase sigma factor [Planctomycetales bacterium]
MEATRLGDPEAFAALVRRHAPAVTAFLRRMTGDAHRAEDLAQEAFLRVYRCARDYRPAARFTTWLYTIALNLARDAHKSDGRHPAVYLEDVPGGVLAEARG